MPTLNNVTVNIEATPANAPQAEHATRFADGYVECFVPAFGPDDPFNIHLTTSSYIAPGIAMYVFIDGQYQCNRNQRGLIPPTKSSAHSDSYVDFRVRQREEPMIHRPGHFIGREWRMKDAIIVDDDSVALAVSGETRDSILHNVGTIEVVVLRLYAEDRPSSTSAALANSQSLALLRSIQGWDPTATDIGLPRNEPDRPSKVSASKSKSKFASATKNGEPSKSLPDMFQGLPDEGESNEPAGKEKKDKSDGKSNAKSKEGDDQKDTAASQASDKKEKQEETEKRVAKPAGLGILDGAGDPIPDNEDTVDINHAAKSPGDGPGPNGNAWSFALDGSSASPPIASRPYIKSYFAQNPYAEGPDGSIAPSDPMIPIPRSEAGDRTHQVQGMRGYYWVHPVDRPRYMDTMSSPLAVFCFRYRSKEAIANLCYGGEIELVDGKAASKTSVKEELMGLSKEELVERFLSAGAKNNDDKSKKKEKTSSPVKASAAGSDSPAAKLPSPSKSKAKKSRSSDTGYISTSSHQTMQRVDKWVDSTSQLQKIDESKELGHKGKADIPGETDGVAGTAGDDETLFAAALPVDTAADEAKSSLAITSGTGEKKKPATSKDEQKPLTSDKEKKHPATTTQKLQDHKKEQDKTDKTAALHSSRDSSNNAWPNNDAPDPTAGAVKTSPQPANSEILPSLAYVPTRGSDAKKEKKPKPKIASQLTPALEMPGTFPLTPRLPCTPIFESIDSYDFAVPVTNTLGVAGGQWNSGFGPGPRHGLGFGFGSGVAKKPDSKIDGANKSNDGTKLDKTKKTSTARVDPRESWAAAMTSYKVPTVEDAHDTTDEAGHTHTHTKSHRKSKSGNKGASKNDKDDKNDAQWPTSTPATNIADWIANKPASHAHSHSGSRAHGTPRKHKSSRKREEADGGWGEVENRNDERASQAWGEGQKGEW